MAILVKQKAGCSYAEAEQSTMFRNLFSVLLFFLPTNWVRFVLPRSIYRIEKGASIGFSWLGMRQIAMRKGARIGHLNYLKCERIALKKAAIIQNMNIIRGPLSLLLEESAQLGNRNIVSRAPIGVAWGRSTLSIGFNSKVTAGHKLDCCRSIKIGRNSIVAGMASQLWTHGYVHEADGQRFRVDGPISIGSNAYISSGCVINAGVMIGSDVTVGSHSCVSKSLTAPGLYVSSALRHIVRTPEQVLGKLAPIDEDLCERVYERKIVQFVRSPTEVDE